MHRINKDKTIDQPLHNYIDRFIILHFGLVPNTGHSGLDEAASNQEWSEFILYYFDRRKRRNYHCSLDTKKNQNLPISKYVYHDDDMIRFAGLCQALYSFPTSLQYKKKKKKKNDSTETNHSKEQDFTKEVQLSTCSLIFIPLESSWTEGLFAVAQCSKQHESSLNPQVIREYIVRSHELFTLIKCGIHDCLMSFDTNYLPVDIRRDLIGNDECELVYPGMGLLYKQHEILRTLVLKQNTYGINHNNIIAQMEHTNKVINLLYSYLPVNYIRKDLKGFYDWVIDSFTSNSKEQIILESLPTIRSPQNKVSLMHCHQITRALQLMVRNTSNEALNELPSLIGYSLFHNSNHIDTHMNIHHHDITSTQARLIHKYFSICSNIPTEYIGYGLYTTPPTSQGLSIRNEDIMKIPKFGTIWLPRLFIHKDYYIKATMYIQNDISVILYLDYTNISSFEINRWNNPNMLIKTTNILHQVAHIIEEKSLSSTSRFNENFDFNNIKAQHFNVYTKQDYKLRKGLKVIYIDPSNNNNDICLYINDESTRIKPIQWKLELPWFLNEITKKKKRTQIKEERLDMISTLEFIITKRRSEYHHAVVDFECCHYLSKNKCWFFQFYDVHSKRELYMFLNHDIFPNFELVMDQVNDICKDFQFC